MWILCSLGKQEVNKLRSKEAFVPPLENHQSPFCSLSLLRARGRVPKSVSHSMQVEDERVVKSNIKCDPATRVIVPTDFVSSFNGRKLNILIYSAVLQPFWIIAAVIGAIWIHVAVHSVAGRKMAQIVGRHAFSSKEVFN